MLGNAHEARGAAGDPRQVDDEHPDDLPEAQGDDGEIVALEPQGRDADDHARDGRQQTAGEEAQHDDADVLPRQALPDQGCCVGAHGHEPGVPQGQLAEIARGHVQRHSQQDVDPDLQDDGALGPIHRA